VSKAEILASSKIVLVLAMARAGLGHLRVTDALYHGLPKAADPILLGAQDEAIEALHRLATVHPVARSIAEYIQREWPQAVFTKLYRQSIRQHTEILYQQVVTILGQRVEQPKTLVVVATHFGLAHQLAAIKLKLAQEKKIRVVLAVVVTDDTPQYIWAVEGADLIFVPSNRTKRALEGYHRNQGWQGTEYVVAPYPVGPRLNRKLAATNWQARQNQAEPEGGKLIKLVIPVSGAAVQLEYFERLVDGLRQEPGRWQVFVVAKEARYTRKFLERMGSRGEGVRLMTSMHDREVVEAYCRLYDREPMLLEVTKPSEQAFKALIEPRRVGGSILLLSDPVGRQERDNLAFLRRHNLIPDQDVQESLWKGHVIDEAKEEMRGWRGLALPSGAAASVKFINWCLKTGVFKKMLEFRGYQKHEELAGNGVEVIWEKIAEHMVKS